jgi:(p)ppGpp synthase/HD superfamily hydrolase
VIDNPIMEDRQVSVEWDVTDREKFLVKLLVTGSDRPNLLVDITGQIAKAGVDIASGNFKRDERDLQTHFTFTLEVRDTEQVELLTRLLKKVRDVQDVTRR